MELREINAHIESKIGTLFIYEGNNDYVWRLFAYDRVDGALYFSRLAQTGSDKSIEIVRKIYESDIDLFMELKTKEGAENVKRR